MVLVCAHGPEPNIGALVILTKAKSGLMLYAIERAWHSPAMQDKGKPKGGPMSTEIPLSEKSEQVEVTRIQEANSLANKEIINIDEGVKLGFFTSRQAGYKLVARREVPFVRLGKSKIRFRLADLRQWVEQGLHPARQDLRPDGDNKENAG